MEINLWGCAQFEILYFIYRLVKNTRIPIIFWNFIVIKILVFSYRTEQKNRFVIVYYVLRSLLICFETYHLIGNNYHWTVRIKNNAVRIITILNKWLRLCFWVSLCVIYLLACLLTLFVKVHRFFIYWTYTINIMLNFWYNLF